MTATDATVAFYATRYRYPFLLTWLLEADRSELESARDDAWYRAGWYEVLGYDRHGRSYTAYDDTDGELMAAFEDAMEREDAKYGGKWGE